MSPSLMTYWRTLRHLRREQIWGRLQRHLPKRPVADAPPPSLRQRRGSFAAPILRAGPIRSGSRFDFLNRSADVTTASDWDDEGVAKLWRYNLHYFDWLRETAAPSRIDDDSAWIDRWIAENPPGRGTGWEPYPLSLRIVNWIVWFSTIGKTTPGRLESLAMQARYLDRSIETHLLGNHLFVNAKALVFAGTFFAGDEAECWRAHGLEILRAQLHEQVLSDGGHFEGSPMYHALILEDVLDLAALGVAYPDAIRAADLGLSDVVQRMHGWLERMSHPDGDISYFNDATFGIAPTHAVLVSYARRVGIDSDRAPASAAVAMPASGYARLSMGSIVCIFDGGRVGPDYIPGHAHADTLSFELSIGGERLITNSGTSTYDRGSEREWERGTSAHSTVMIDGQNSAETWASFRVGRRPNVTPIETGETFDSAWAACAHDGYHHLPGRPIHRRRIAVAATGVEVADTIDGAGEHELAGFLHVHPGILVDAGENGSVLLTTPSGTAVKVHIEGAADVAVTQGRFAEGFGKVVARPTIAWRWRGALPHDVRTHIRIRGAGSCA
ncbi:MAG: heparinase II/III family protein [Variibacter sp.]